MKPFIKTLSIVVFSILFMTGIAYAVPVYLDTLLGIDFPFDIPTLLMMAIHGFFAMIAFILFGIIIECHVIKKFKFPEKRRSGVAMLVMMVVITVTAFLLYYSGGDVIRSVSSLIHTSIGTLFFLIFIWHYRIQKR